MGNHKSNARVFSLSKVRTKLLRKLLQGVNKDEPGADRARKQMRAAYERQEAELVRSLEHTRRVLALLREESTTALDERNRVEQTFWGE